MELTTCGVCKRRLRSETVPTSEGPVVIALCDWCDRRRCGNCELPEPTGRNGEPCRDCRKPVYIS